VISLLGIHLRLNEHSGLARYRIDRFLLEVASQIADGILLLDAGAGNCKHKSFFPHVRYVAIDLKQHRRRRYGPIDVSADVQKLPFREGTFGVVLSIEVLEHLREPRETLKELFRVLQPGGRLFLIAPQMWEEHSMPHDYWRFTSSGLRYALEGAGFQVLSVTPLEGYFSCLGHMLSASYRYFFPTHRKTVWKFLDAPFRHPARLLLRTVIPYLCVSLDSLDRQRSFTLNYGCICQKPLI